MSKSNEKSKIVKMKPITIKGDLIKLAQEGKFDIIIHGCNCFCTMGAGIAPQIAQAFPEAELVDKQTKLGDRYKLGSVSITKNTKPMVINCYSQYDFGSKDGPAINYTALKSALSTVKAYAQKFHPNPCKEVKIGMPMIGAGLAGGDWNRILKMINDTFTDTVNCQPIIVEYKPTKTKYK